MTPLPSHFEAPAAIAWRLDPAPYAPTWDSGEGAYRFGGRWNSRGRRAVYTSFEASLTILEVAVHKGFKSLNTLPRVLTSLRVLDPAAVHIVRPEDVPNPHWLVPGSVSAGQQAFGDQMLTEHQFVLVPSVVSKRSWNLIFDSTLAAGAYEVLGQEAFALDPRLHPAAA